ncbi:MAG: hypothetical protein PHX61_01530 [Alphaproteobacteria bacterium]|nr:hypothetical protein [Alphaproteobacteria bacterium]
MGTLGKVDPINKNYYEPIEYTERWTFILFFIGGILSFSPLLVEFIPSYIYKAVQIVFLCTVMALFILNHVLRLYLIPQAEESRVQDFLSSAYGIQLIQDTTKKYYNNEEKFSSRKAALQLLENLFFTKCVSAEMLKCMRPFFYVYLISWVMLISCREVSLDWVFIASQVVFSEEVLSKYIRLEYLRHRAGKLYDEVYRLFQTTQSHFEIYALEKFVIYEKVKAGLGITLSSKVFNKLNDELSIRWTTICKSLENSGEQK